MKRNISRAAQALSIMLAALMTIQSAGGLFIRGLYRDNVWVASAWLANDLVTLLVAVPVLALSLLLSRRGSTRARLVWLGALYYGLYNNMYYLFGSAFNPFFLVYVAVAIASSFGLVAGLTELDADSIRREFTAETPRKIVGSWMFLFAGTLGVMWIGQCTVSIATGQLPQLIADSGGITHLVAVLDLWMIVAPAVLAGAWLIRGRSWGYVLTPSLLVQGILTTMVLIVSAPVMSGAGIAGAWALVPLWAAIGIGCVISCCLLLKNIYPAPSGGRA